jgi:hypothetical protein
MNHSNGIDDLRIRVWDYLYALRQSREIPTIANELQENPLDVAEAVNHAWFIEQHGAISIAVDSP